MVSREFAIGQMPMRRARAVIGGHRSALSLPLRARADRRNWAGIAAEIKKRVPRDPHSKHSDVLEETSKK
jgi:hypothetical protein